MVRAKKSSKSHQMGHVFVLIKLEETRWGRKNNPIIFPNGTFITYTRHSLKQAVLGMARWGKIACNNQPNAYLIKRSCWTSRSTTRNRLKINDASQRQCNLRKWSIKTCYRKQFQFPLKNFYHWTKQKLFSRQPEDIDDGKVNRNHSSLLS